MTTLHPRAIFACAFAVTLLSACRGGTGAPALPTVPQRSLSGPVHDAAFTAPAFRPIGPNDMSDGLPTSGKVNAYAVDPKNPKIIYAASGRGTGLETYSSAGILRTSDGGASWKSAMNGLTDRAGITSSTINALWLDAKNPAVLLAASEYDGIFRSADRGSSWNSVYRTTYATQFASFGGSLYAATAAGILTSTDDGQTWSIQQPANAQQRPTAFGAVEGSSGAAFYAGMTDGSIFAFANGSWSKVGKLPYNANTGSDGSTSWVHQIAVDPRTPSTLYASENNGLWDQDLFASTNGGRSWTQILKKAYVNLGLGTQAIAYSAVHPHMLYLGVDGGFYIIDGDGRPKPRAHRAANLSVIDVRNVWVSPNGKDDACWIASDQGLDEATACSTPTRQYTDHVVTASSATGLARRFAVTPNGKTVLVSLQDFDSHVTFNGGGSWKVSRAGLYEDGFNELRPGSASVCYAYDEAYGLRVSNDGCATFAMPQGRQGHIFPSRLMTTPIAFDPKNPLAMYLLSGPSLGYNYALGAYASSDGGKTLAKLSWPFAEPGTIAVDANNGAHIVVGDLRFSAGSRYSSLSVTADGGKTWSKSSGVPPTGFWYAATISPANGQIVLASSVDAANNVFVLRSTNGGRSFTRVAIVTNAPLLRERADPDHHPLVAGAAGETSDLQPGGPPEAYVYSPEREIRYNQDVTHGRPDVVITTLRGAYVSSNDGSTWRRLDNDLIAHSFWGIRWISGYLYLGSDGQGIVKSTVPVQLP